MLRVRIGPNRTGAVGGCQSAGTIKLNLVDVPGVGFSVMRSPASKGFFRQFIDEIGSMALTGHGLVSRIKMGGKQEIMTATMEEWEAFAPAFIDWANKKTGKNLRIPTVEEYKVIYQQGSQIKLIGCDRELSTREGWKVIVALSGDKLISIIERVLGYQDDTAALRLIAE